MTRKIAAGCFAAMFGLAVSAGAQTPPSSPQTPPSQPPSTPSQPPSSPTSPYPSGQSSSEKAGATKLTGCVQAGTTASSFELTNVKKGSGSMSTPSSSSPSSSSPSSAPGASASASASDKGTIKLVASPSVDLASHVGHTVEVSGSWKGGSDSSSASSPSASSPSSSASSSSAGKEFNVTSVKMVSSSCTAGTN